MKKSLVLFIILSLSLLLLSGIASAATITLVNLSGTDIHQLNVSLASQGTWGGDILGNEVLGNNQQVAISLDANAGAWDMQALDSSGNSLSWTNLNLSGVSKITLDRSGTANME